MALVQFARKLKCYTYQFGRTKNNYLMNNCIRKAFICIYLMTTYSISLKALNYCFLDDFSKGISKIEYDVLDNLSSITFNNGFKTKYVYDAGGSKLRTIHEALTTNTTDYIGDFIFEDGKLSKYQSEGGYCSFDSNLALALKYQGRTDEAYELFWKATWNKGWADAGYFAAAQI